LRTPPVKVLTAFWRKRGILVQYPSLRIPGATLAQCRHDVSTGQRPYCLC
jgi:hypothetical protein